MEDLKVAVSTAFANVVASGAIEAAIQDQVGKAITSAIKDQISGYNSEFGKKINEKVKTLIDINLDEIDLPSYRQLIGDVIKQRVGAVMSTEFTEKLDKDICELLQPVPAEITLENLLGEFVASKRDAYNVYELSGNDFTLIIERSERADSYVDIYIDEEPSKQKYSCDIHLRIKGEGEVWAIKLNGDDLKNKIFVGPLYNFEKRLFQMYTTKTRLIIAAGATEDDFDTTFPYHD